MARLALAPILDHPVGSTSRLRDGFTTARWDAPIGVLDIGIGTGVPDQIAAIIAKGDAQGWNSISVVVGPAADARIAARVNTLLRGTGAPRLETYHRTGRMTLRAPRHAIDLPCVFTVARPSPSAAWRLTEVRAIPTGAAVQRPATPTPAPEPAQTPEPAPEPAVAPEAPVRIVAKPRPQCGCPAGGCMFVYPGEQDAHRIIVPTIVEAATTAAVAKHRRGKAATICLAGPKGTGKTEYLWDVASQNGMPLFVYDGAAAQTSADFLGSMALVSDDKGNTVTTFIPAAFIEAIRADGPHGDEERMVVVDEVNRAPDGAALNTLMPILSAKRIYIPEQGRTVEVSKNVLFGFTLNEGASYNQTESLDAAVRDRLQTWLMLDYLSPASETNLLVERTGIDTTDASRLVSAANQVRDIAKRGDIDEGISTRRVLDAAEMVVSGMNLRDAAEVSWANYYPHEGGEAGERGLVLVAINSSLY